MTDLVYGAAILEWGTERQKGMIIEECAELIDAVCKYERGRADQKDILSELADVQIMIEQALIIYGISYTEFCEEYNRKLKRLCDRLGVM